MRFVGRLDRVPAGWAIVAEPHVMIRMKRVFSKVDEDSKGAAILSDTTENALDLVWFTQRYPLETSDGEHLKAQAVRQVALEGKIKTLLGPGYVPREFPLALPARAYQRLAADLATKTGRLLLADEVGLGKSCAAIAMLTEPGTRPALVVTLTHLPRQWQDEFGRFMPSAKTHVIKSTTPYTIMGSPDVVLMSYSKLAGWHHALAGRFRTVIFDECVTAETEVSLWPLARGRVRIVDLVPGDRVAAFTEDGGLTDDRVIGVTPKGAKKVWRLVLADGRFLECSENERIFTDRGWRHAGDIVNETIARNAAQQADGSVRPQPATGPGMPSGGRQPRHAAEQSEDIVSTRAEAGGIPQVQGRSAGRLHQDAAAPGSKRRLRNGLLGVPHGHHSGVRVLALPLHQGRTEDGQSSVARSDDVGGDRLLVHGRRSRHNEERDGGVQYTRVLRGGSSPALGMDALHGDPIGGGPGDDIGGEAVLDASPSSQGGVVVGREDPAVRTGLYGLQGDGAGTAVPHPVHGVWPDVGTEGASDGIGLLSDGRVQEGERQALVPHEVVEAIAIGTIDVFDVETDRHHTIIANGFAVHNCQELRRTGTQKYTAAKHIVEKTRLRIGLTATPIYNYGGEIWSLLDMIAPGALGTWDEFKREWCGEALNDLQSKVPIKNPAALGAHLLEAGLMLRRTRRDVNRELPALTIVPHTIEADLAVIDKIASNAMELARIILYQGGQKRGEKMHAAEEFTNKLRQYTGLAKAPFVADFVRMLVESGEPVLLYGWHRAVYEIWRERLKDLNPVMFTGTESIPQKLEAKDKFLKGKSQVLIMSLRAGAGIDGLQKVCRTVVNGELDWSPGVHHQGIGRIHRDGQPDPVVAYYLVADSGSDPTVSDVLGIKRSQSDAMLDPKAPLVGAQTADPERVKRLAEEFLRQRSGRRAA